MKSKREQLLMVAIAAAAVTVGAPRRGEAQSRGFIVGLDVGVLRPELGRHEREFWKGVGDFQAGPSADATMGYVWGRVGASLDVHTAQTSIGHRAAGSLGIAASVNWHPALRLREWSPSISAGVVRLALGGASATQSELRTDFLDPNGVGGVPTEPQETTMVGNGMRFMIAFERPVGSSVSLRLFGGADVLSFGTVTYMHQDFTFHGADWSSLPRIGVGLRYWPRVRLQ